MSRFTSNGVPPNKVHCGENLFDLCDRRYMFVVVAAVPPPLGLTALLLGGEIFLVKFHVGINYCHHQFERIADFHTTAFLSSKQGSIHCSRFKQGVHG